MSYEFKAEKPNYNRIIEENPDAEVMLVSGPLGAVIIRPGFIKAHKGQVLMDEKITWCWGFSGIYHANNIYRTFSFVPHAIYPPKGWRVNDLPTKEIEDVLEAVEPPAEKPIKFTVEAF
jgi:hypothetical protein